MKHVANIQFFFRKDVHQSLSRRYTEELGDARRDHIRIDQQDRGVHLHRDAHCQVKRTKALALAGECAGDHDQISVLDRCRAFHPGVADDWPLDDAELVYQLGLGVVGGHEACGTQGLNVDLQVVSSLARAPGGLYARIFPYILLIGILLRGREMNRLYRFCDPLGKRWQ